MSSPAHRTRTLATISTLALLLGAGLAGAPRTAHAQSQQPSAAQHDIDLPAGPLEASLVRLADVTGVQLVYSAQVSSGIRAPAVRGRMDAATAFARVLAGSGLTYRFIDARTVTIERVPQSVEDDGSRVLGPVRVEGSQSAYAGPPTRGDGVAQFGGVRGAQDEEERGYRPVVATVGGGSPVAIEDIPRAVSVVTQEQMQSLDVRDIGEALARLPGVSIRESEGGTLVNAGITVRGFGVTKYQIDGGAAQEFDSIGRGLLNLDAYERVELVRGGTGAYAGAGSPGGSINLVRKRPGAQERLELSGAIGAWGRHDIGVDYSTPQVLNSPFAFRGVATYKSAGAFYDNYDQADLSLYGILDAPLGDRARLEFGGLYSETNIDGGYQGILHYADGPMFDVPHDFNFIQSDAYSDMTTKELFAKIYVDVLDNMDFEFGLRYSNLVTSAIDAGYGISLLSSGGVAFATPTFQNYVLWENDTSRFLLDAKLSGTVTTFGLKHQYLISASFNQSDLPNQAGNTLGQREVLTLEEFLAPFDLVAVNPTDIESNGFRYASAYVFSDTVSWGDHLDFNLTLRADSEGRTSYQVFRRPDLGRVTAYNRPNVREENELEIVPTWSVTWKPLSGLSLYYVRSEGFERQDEFFSRSGAGPNYVYEPLPPTRYENEEAGIKYGAEDWLMSASLYRQEQVGIILGSGLFACPPQLDGSGEPVSQCYEASSGGQTSTGVDVEFVGKVLPGLDASFAYSWFEGGTLDEVHRPVQLTSPSHDAKLFLAWQPESLPRWKFRGGVRHRSALVEEGVADIYSPPPDPQYVGSVPSIFGSPAFTVFDLGATFKWSDALSLDIFAENVTDEEYFSTSSRTYSYAGNPRNFVVSLRWTDLGAAPFNGVSPSTGLAPFGDPADWYAAFDAGWHGSSDLDALADGAAQDGVSEVRWNFETEDSITSFVRLGYRVRDNWRMEVEGGYRGAEFGDIGGNAVAPFGVCGAHQAQSNVPFDCDDAQGSIKTWSLLANAIYDFGAPGARIRPFVGAGAGLNHASVAFNGKMEGIGPLTTPWSTSRQRLERITSSDLVNSLALQVQAGASWAISDRANVGLVYRYYVVPDLTWGSYNLDGPFGFSANPPQPLTPRLGDFEADYEDHSITVGLRWAFGAR